MSIQIGNTQIKVRKIDFTVSCQILFAKNVDHFVLVHAKKGQHNLPPKPVFFLSLFFFNTINSQRKILYLSKRGADFYICKKRNQYQNLKELCVIDPIFISTFCYGDSQSGGNDDCGTNHALLNLSFNANV